jgi:hypothetical protein
MRPWKFSKYGISKPFDYYNYHNIGNYPCPIFYFKKRFGDELSPKRRVFK